MSGAGEATTGSSLHRWIRLSLGASIVLLLFGGLVWVGLALAARGHPAASTSPVPIAGAASPSVSSAPNDPRVAQAGGYCLIEAKRGTQHIPITGRTAWSVASAAIKRGIAPEVQSLTGWWRLGERPGTDASGHHTRPGVMFLHFGPHLPTDGSTPVPMVEVTRNTNGWQLGSAGYGGCNPIKSVRLTAISR